MPPPSVPAAPVLACDLDETLLRVNTFPLFVRWCAGELARRRDAVGIVRLAAAVVRRRVLRGSHRAFKQAVHRAGDRLDPASVHRWAQGVVQAELNDAVADKVRSWAGGTVLVTAAPGVYAEAIGALTGFDLVQASGHREGGYVENAREAKAARLAGVLTAPLQCAITDDPVIDAPLLAMASEPLLVGADGALIEQSGAA